MFYVNVLSVNSSCSKVVPSHQSLSDWQKKGLEIISSQQGRDVVFAIDLTGSVRLDDEGRLRLKQIISDSLRPGDAVYVVPFASTVNPLKLKADSLASVSMIPFNGNLTDVDRILQELPLKSSDDLRNTDIQLAELTIYMGLAQLNQGRLTSNIGVKFQSVVWVTDAPLLTKPGITSDTWNETPANSPFRREDSAESKERQQWINILPLQRRSQKIATYDLSVVDVAPTVQEFCTLAPSGQETCLINRYLFQQLWMPALISFLCIVVVLTGGAWWFKRWNSFRKKWKVTITDETGSEEQIHYLANRQKLGIGSDIECRGQDVRGYLQREGNKLFLEPSSSSSIYYQNSEVTKRQILTGRHIRLSYLHKSSDLELTITIN